MGVGRREPGGAGVGASEGGRLDRGFEPGIILGLGGEAEAGLPGGFFNSLAEQFVWAFARLAARVQRQGPPVGASGRAAREETSYKAGRPASVELKLKSLIMAQIERWRHA